MFDPIMNRIPDILAGRSRPRVDDLNLIKDVFTELSKQIGELLTLPDEVVPLLDHKAALGYFLVNRSKAPGAVKGIMLLEPHESGYLFTQVFLDTRDQPVHDLEGRLVGRRMVVEKLDTVLTETFGDNDLVVVE